MSWQLLGSENDHVAATRLKDVGRYHSWVKTTLGDGPIEGSGIVVSRMDAGPFSSPICDGRFGIPAGGNV